ncbi:aminotransferase [Parasphingopyxis sp. CP4]|uniref:aminotransferase n=1 Tax=Parasphingopyxis sp. CP4 TaxID=2724527 RepID=UPI0015A3477C|nr:aminotransferase [Parasphingopyxis sp. CP4]QLC20811.1 aminotransferase [Parasphingopyxis sp. CP4]
MNPNFADLPTTIFEDMSIRARERGAINLGQGFPDAEGPEDVRRAAAEATINGPNQYPPMRGIPALRKAIADHYAHHQDLAIDGDKEVVVTSGATEALAASILGLVRPGDEAIIVQPAYDAYAPLVRQAGGTPRFIRSGPPDWTITRDSLEAAITDKTRVIILNSPHNPTATMLSETELRLLAEVCKTHDLVAICDEVWEHLTFDGRTHKSLMAMSGMEARTVKIGSAGKIFSLTGWKVGWAIAAPPLANVIAKTHQFLTFTTPPNLQAGVAYGLSKNDSYFDDMRADFQRSRDRLSTALSQTGFSILPCAATYFLSVDLEASGIALGDRDFAIRLVEDAGVAVIPISPFYESDPVTSIVRLCFAKGDEMLDQAAERLATARKLFT